MNLCVLDSSWHIEVECFPDWSLGSVGYETRPHVFYDILGTLGQ